MPTPKRSSAGWEALARRRLKALVAVARGVPALRRRGPRAAKWTVDIRVTGSAAIARLNRELRGVKGPTDVLSFPAPEPFHSAGHLGDLCVCLPVLRSQARERGHKPEDELQVLLVHGLLHLLGLDHEKGPRQAREMARLEARVLSRTSGRKLLSGLIERLDSSKPRRSHG